MARKLLTVDEFRASAKETGSAPDGTVTRVVTDDPQSIDEASRTIRFVFSDATVDRSGDSIMQSGWQIDQFVKNPVALWAHDSYAPPIGRATNVGVAGGRLIGDIEFMAAEVSPFADSIFRMVKGGFVRAVSVGFIPLKYVFVSDPARPWGIDFVEQELLEISVCPIPCNPNALQEARSKGIDTAPLREWAERVLDGAGQVAVPRALLEETFRTAKTPRSVRQKYLTPRQRAETSDWTVGAARDLPIEEADTWDGPAAAERMLDAAGFNGDTPDAAAAARGFLIHDAANPALKGSYKLPFADLIDGHLKAVAAGVRAAASRLPQTDAPRTVLDDARTVVDDYEAKMSKMAVRRTAFAALRKDLDNVSWLASLLGSLAALTGWIEWETELEGNDSSIAGRLSGVLAALGQILVDMTAEEVAELLGDGAADPMLMTATTPGQKALIALAGLGEGKAGRRISAVNMALLTKAMDHHAAATQCVKDVQASNEGDDPLDPGDALIVDPVPEEDDRAKRIREARALKDAAPKPE